MKQPEIKVDLINSTNNPVDTLIYTKSTRLEQGEDTRNKIANMDPEQKTKELAYMANTIPSSWEMVNYIFEIKNVTRAFTHQFVRTRTGSYAQQTMRMLDKKEFTYRIPPTIKAYGEDDTRYQEYVRCMENIQLTYDNLVREDVPIEDARGVLPTNIHTNIIAQFNLRTISEMAKSRTGLRTQDEYREVLEQMLDAVMEIHPWAQPFLYPERMKNIKIVENFIAEKATDLPSEEKYDLLKAVDQVRKGNY